MHFVRSRPLRLALIATVAALGVVSRAVAAEPRDPLVPIVQRMSDYFHSIEAEGVALDARYDLSPSETIRLSVVSQLLGYCEIYRVQPAAGFRQDIADRADYLLPRIAAVRSFGPFDGMLALSLLEAYDVTGDARYLASATPIVNDLLALPTSQTILNGGLMAALGIAKYARVTGSAPAETRATQIIASLPPYQNANGSFPHWCPGSTDVHYTGWMSMELILLRRLIQDPLIDPLLAGTLGFIRARVDSSGDTRYEEPCDDYPGCVEYFYSIATGCEIDVDTRAFTNELGYSALVFDAYSDPEYYRVMQFASSLEKGGTFADKWDFWPPPSDPYYPWTIADTSVVNMSVMLWSFGSILSERQIRSPGTTVWGLDDGGGSTPPRAARPLPAPGDTRASQPQPPMRLSALAAGSPGAGATLRVSAARASAGSIRFFDPSGRLVRHLAVGFATGGEQLVYWDGRSDENRRCPPGLYFARASAAGETASARVRLR